MPIASRKPLRMSPSTAGSMILNSISARVAESERPSSSHCGLMLRTPEAVFRIIGHTAANASKK